MDRSKLFNILYVLCLFLILLAFYISGHNNLLLGILIIVIWILGMILGVLAKRETNTTNNVNIIIKKTRSIKR